MKRTRLNKRSEQNKTKQNKTNNNKDGILFQILFIIIYFFQYFSQVSESNLNQYVLVYGTCAVVLNARVDYLFRII